MKIYILKKDNGFRNNSIVFESTYKYSMLDKIK